MELVFHPDPTRTPSTNLNDKKHCCVYSEKLLMMDKGNVRNINLIISACSCFIIRIRHDSRSHEHTILGVFCSTNHLLKGKVSLFKPRSIEGE